MGKETWEKGKTIFTVLPASPAGQNQNGVELILQINFVKKTEKWIQAKTFEFVHFF